jgi:stress response protein YsnF
MSSNSSENSQQEGLRIPVIEEQLAVGTRLVETGRGVRIHKTVTEQPVTIDERLARDEVDVRHVPVDRIVALEEAPATRYEGDTLVVPVLEEVLVVERRLRIKEELHITRVRHEEHYRDTVPLKAERVEVERFDEAAAPPASDTHQ